MKQKAQKSDKEESNCQRPSYWKKREKGLDYKNDIITWIIKLYSSTVYITKVNEHPFYRLHYFTANIWFVRFCYSLSVCFLYFLCFCPLSVVVWLFVIPESCYPFSTLTLVPHLKHYISVFIPLCFPLFPTRLLCNVPLIPAFTCRSARFNLFCEPPSLGLPYWI